MDIASWLREVRMSTNTSDWNAAFVNNRLDEAANEIERLRDEVHFDVHTINALSENNDLLEAENKRLREALEKIALSVCEIKTDSAGAWSYCITIAKTALKEGK